MSIITCEKIPANISGDMSIKRVVFTEKTNVGTWQRPSFVDKGFQYVALKKNNSVFMSNTPDEKRSNIFHFPENMSDEPNILIGGLGIGLCLEQLQRQERFSINKVIVVEKSQDVIDLVAQTYESIPWLEIVHGDIREYGKNGPKKFFDFAYVDIWMHICTDDLEDMSAVRKSLRPVLKPGPGRVQCWSENLLKSMKRNGHWA